MSHSTTPVAQRLLTNKQRIMNDKAKEFNVGDILYYEYDYDRIIPHFLKVVKVTPSTIKAVELRKNFSPIDGYCQEGYETPVDIEITPECEKMAHTYRINKFGHINCRGHYKWRIYKWHGKAIMRTSD